MSDRARRVTHALSAAFLIVTCTGLLAGCGGIGLPGTGDPEPPRYPPETSVTGEVVRVDDADRRIEVDDAGRRHVIAYRAGTPVYFEGRTYEPEDLERGDVIRARVVDERYGTVTTDRIDVVESVQSRGGYDGPYDDDRYEDDPFDDGYAELDGEIDRVDPDRQEIIVRTADGDRLVTYDDRTRVVYQGQDYRPENLERGDLVEISTADRSGSRYALATRIDVTRSVQDRQDRESYDDRSDDTDRLAGTVDWVDRRRGEFGLRTSRETVTVEIPFDAGESIRDRFERLDRGDYVQVEVQEVEQSSRLELVRFL